ncbi:MAG: diphthamide biosynthesis enzyme Dph2 [Thermoprotei archaeon]|nr:MAG: diphthamide biosynthesis enzyme Dph2 [Thermoprotei archaeon]RLF22705.1 MAG: diphthamide biosynthesis enzyme Dph2 [Thermoprotei archaeon]
MELYDFRIGEVVGFIKRRRAKRVLMQFADGLKQYSKQVTDEVSSKLREVELVVSGDSCYGACDVAFDEALSIGADCLIHFGHAPFPEAYSYAERVGVNILFVEGFSNLDVINPLEKAISLLSELNAKAVGLTATVQHVHSLPRAVSYLRSRGYEAYVGRACGRAFYDGQVLGCDYSTATAISDRVDAFIHLGGGLFHALGLRLMVDKPVIACDPYRGGAYIIDEEARKVKASRLYTVAKCMDLKSFGVVVGCKWRQRHMSSAKMIRDSLKAKGYEALLLTVREVTPETLENFVDLDAFVITACPRIPIDDYERFRKPLLTVREVMILTGHLKLEEWALCDWEFNEKAPRYTAV